MIQRSDDASPAPAFHTEVVAEGPRAARLRIEGELGLAHGEALLRELLASVPQDAREVLLDVAGVESIDGASAALLLEVRGRVRARGDRCEVVGASREVATLLELYGCPNESTCLKAAPTSLGMLDQVGRSTAESLERTRGVLGFVGDLVTSILAAGRRPRSVNWADLGGLMERTGADGTPIVLLINFLVGLIIALQAALQLERFGANVFVADLVGLSMVRELGPLMTAIIVAGRSGAAYAAELGSMRVAEEIDALSAMRIDPMRHLVFPRVLALLVVVPGLTLLADVVGCVGGLLVALYSLGLSIETYTSELRQAVDASDLSSGLVKSAVFAATIALIACQRGLATRGGASGVGSATTSAVVSTLFALVVLDALFTALFHALGI